jgi:uncharacterized membrane protein
MLVAGGILLVLGTITGEFGRIDTSKFSRASVLAVAYLIVFGSWLGYTSYLWLLRNARTSLVSTYAYVTPVGAVLLGAVVLNESITPRTVFAGALILVAVAVIIRAGGVRRVIEPGSDAESDAGKERRAEVEAQVALERMGGSQERGLGKDGRGELQADGEPA